MRKTFRSFSDYHKSDSEVQTASTTLPHLRICALREGSGELELIQNGRNAIMVSVDGSATHLTRMDGTDDSTPVQCGDVCLLPIGIGVHFVWTNHEATQRTLMIEFDTELFRTYAPEFNTDDFLRGHLVPANFSARPCLGAIVNLLGGEVDINHRRGRLFGETAARVLDRRVARAIDFIEVGFSTDLSIADIAAAAGMSVTQLGNGFRAATGKSPYAYVIDRRLQQAVHLLRTTDLPITIVALEAGFLDQSHLTRIAQQRLSQTPRAIRLG
jgi:AraC-like DNA-binding protein